MSYQVASHSGRGYDSHRVSCLGAVTRVCHFASLVTAVFTTPLFAHRQPAAGAFFVCGGGEVEVPATTRADAVRGERA